MAQDYEADLLSLIDDQGVEHSFEILDELEIDEGHFMALSPIGDTAEEFSEAAQTYFIFELIEEDGEEQLQEVEDDDLFARLADLFEERFNNLYFDDEEE